MTVMQIISRKEAKEQGLSRYFTGPCDKGHTGGYYVSSGQCACCTKERNKLKYKVDEVWAERMRSRERERYTLDAEHARRKREGFKAYQRANLASFNERAARRYASKRQATPLWLTKEHHAEMAATFRRAKQIEKMTGVKMHVDHIVPIKGKNATGLHVPWNLRVIPAPENTSKRNTLDPELSQPACIVTVLPVVLPERQQCAIMGTEGLKWTH